MFNIKNSSENFGRSIEIHLEGSLKKILELILVYQILVKLDI